MSKLALIVATAIALIGSVAPSARAHDANDVLPHQYVATLNARQQVPRTQGNGLALFRVTLDQRPHVSQATRPFKPGDPLLWRVAFTRLSSPVRAITLRAAPPARKGRVLVTLCGPCAAGAHGTLPLNGPLAIALDQAPFCSVKSPCSTAEPEQFAVYVEIATTRYPQGEIRGQLRFCSPRPTFHNHGSCSPPDYPALAANGR